MLRKMVLQGMVAALFIGGAALVYAQAQDNGYLSAPAGIRSDSGKIDKDSRHGEHGHKAEGQHVSRHGDRHHGGDHD
ncbi:MAG: hypothetical protein AB7S58_25320 [Dongiaceae bacterium]